MFVASFDGRLASDAELRYTPEGRPHVNFTVMTDFFFSGQEEPTTMAIRCTYWQEKDKLVPHMTKGRQVFVNGDCRFSIYNAKGKVGINIDCNVSRVVLGAIPKGAER